MNVAEKLARNGRTVLVVRPIHLADMLGQKRADLRIGVRAAAKLAKVSASTFSRVETGGTPDVPSLIKLSAWVLKP